MRMQPEALFDKYLQKTLSRQESDQLRDLLDSDPEIGRDFVDYVLETAFIIETSQLLATQKTVEPSRRPRVLCFMPAFPGDSLTYRNRLF